MSLIFSYPVGPLQCNMTIIANAQTKEGVLVDPGGDFNLIKDIIESNNLKIVQILITHAHFDHILASKDVSDLTGAPVYFHQEDRKLWLTLPFQCMIIGVPRPAQKMPPPTNYLQDGDSIMYPNACVFHTPGHTEGSCCFYFPDDNLLCSGDTLFQGSVGRTDLPGGNHGKLIESIREKILTLPDDTRIITGHGPETTVIEEKRGNPFLVIN